MDDAILYVNYFLRWFHIMAGIMWIGLLYFFNFVNIPFQGALDKDTKRSVNPELLPRALFWFRWGAMFTFLFGFTLLMVKYFGGNLWVQDGKMSEHRFPFRGMPDQRLVYQQDSNSGGGNIRLNEGVPFSWLCMTGGPGETWVGPWDQGDKNRSMLRVICDRLEDNSWQVGKETIDGFPCLVFFYKFRHIRSGEKYYVDEKRFLLRRWIGFRTIDGHVVTMIMDIHFHKDGQ